MPRGRPEPAPRDDKGRYAPDRPSGGGGRFGCSVVFALPGLVGLAGVFWYLVV